MGDCGELRRLVAEWAAKQHAPAVVRWDVEKRLRAAVEDEAS